MAIALFLSSLSGHAVGANPPEVDARAAIQQYADGWNRMSGAEFAKPFHEKAHFVNIFGMHFTGKAGTAKRHQKIFDTFLKGTEFVVEDIKLDRINDFVMVAHVVWNLKGFQTDHCLKNPQENSLKCPRRGIFNHVLVPKESQAGGWVIVETQNTLIAKK